MRIAADPFFHLTYCTNIHPGENWSAVLKNLKQHLPPLKSRLSPDGAFGIGLRLSDAAARELLQGDRLARLRSWLDREGLYVFTLNGFPYGGFHRQVVKDRVYAPDWGSPARVDYTVRLAHILAALLPEDMDGGISTVPLSYKPWHEDKTAREVALRKGSLNLARVAATLVHIEQGTGKHLHVDLEPEPDCLIENSDETIDFFQRWLLPHGGASLVAQLGLTQTQAEAVLLEHVGVCYDACHFAVQYERAADALARLKDHGIRIGKIQLSAALKLTLTAVSDKQRAAETLDPFIDPVYLHQIVESRKDGGLHHYPDLTAMAQPHPDAREWRIHFHVPIFIDDYGAIHSTQDELRLALEALRENHQCPHLEIETYTWEVLPPDLKLDVSASIQREYEWVIGAFADIASSCGRLNRGASSSGL